MTGTPEKPAKVGLLGGTFNPVHRGHIELGLNIREQFNLDRVLYILSARPPHKKGQDIAPAELRWRMLQRALAPFPFLVPCDIEMKRQRDSYTVETVEQLMGARPGDMFYFISGSEGFLKIQTWKDYKKLLHALPFIVLLRKESHQAAVEKILTAEGIPLRSCPLPPGPGPMACFFRYDADSMGISSTLIRRRVKAAGCIDDLVEEDVKRIMQENKLYEQ